MAIMVLMDDALDALAGVIETSLAAKLVAINDRWGLVGAARAEAPAAFYRSEQLAFPRTPAVLVIAGDTDNLDGDADPASIVNLIEVGVSISGNDPAILSRQIRVYVHAINELIAEDRSLGNRCVFAIVTNDGYGRVGSEGSMLFQEASIAVSVFASEPQRVMSSAFGF
jgi:hypothetical protein